MPNGTKQTPDEIKAEIEIFAALGGNFAVVATETLGMLNDYDEVKAQLKTMKDGIKTNLRRMARAAKALNPKE